MLNRSGLRPDDTRQQLSGMISERWGKLKDEVKNLIKCYVKFLENKSLFHWCKRKQRCEVFHSTTWNWDWLFPNEILRSQIRNLCTISKDSEGCPAWCIHSDICSLVKNSWWSVTCLPGGMTRISANFVDWRIKE